ncbi:hypothetical protein [Miltoncostaea oceani]|uniref:hypothetical protein n=1 Tax=Miltoncostaea oceani TaxID=2843216 RepID=UPI001C3E52AF|nr:hypothetical protein [Miltoncostaea oceani]
MLIVVVLVAVGTGLAVAANQGNEEAPAGLGTTQVSAFLRLDAAPRPLPGRAADAIGRAGLGVNAGRAVEAAEHEGYTLYLAAADDEGEVCLVPARSSAVISVLCGPRSNVADGKSFGTLVVSEPSKDGSGGSGFDFYLVPDGYEEVASANGRAPVVDNVAVLPRPDSNKPQGVLTYVRSDGRRVAVP